MSSQSQFLNSQQFAWEGKEWPIQTGSKGDAYTIKGTVERTYGLAVRNANLSTTYLRNDVSRDVCDQRLVIVLDVSEVKQKGASSSVSAYVGDISANFLKPNCNSKDEKDLQKHIALDAASSSSSSSASSASSSKQLICIWAPSTIVATLAAREDATAEPLSKGTVVEISTAGNSPLLASIDILKPGPCYVKPASKEKEVANVKDKMTSFVDKYMQREKEKAAANPSSAKKDDDDWE